VALVRQMVKCGPTGMRACSLGLLGLGFWIRSGLVLGKGLVLGLAMVLGLALFTFDKNEVVVTRLAVHAMINHNCLCRLWVKCGPAEMRASAGC